MIPQSFDQIFAEVALNEDPTKRFLVTTSYLEIYNEEVRDLLGKDTKAALPLKEDPERGVYVKGLTLNVVGSTEDCNVICFLCPCLFLLLLGIWIGI